MTSETMNQGRRSATLAAVIGTVLATYAGSAAAIEFEMDNGARLNWNTTISAGASFRANDPSRLLYTKADGSLIGIGSGPRPPGTGVGPGDGLAGNQAASSANLNYGSGDMFSAPLKLVTDVEYKKGNYGFLVRAKAWYDYATSDTDVRIGNQANNYNGGRPDPSTPGYGIPGSYPPCVGANANNNVPTCMPLDGRWPKDKLSDEGFETEQKFSNAMLLDAYVYGSFDLQDTNLQVRLGNQVVNWGESVFIQGVNQINPIDVPAARRPGTELKEILLPVWMAYANWGFDWGSIEAFYQLEWQNTSIDGCGTYWSVTENNISVDPGRCRSATVITSVIGGAISGTSSPLYPQLGSNPYSQANGLNVPLVEGKEARDNGQVGIALRFPVEKLDTEFGLYAQRIHSRLPIISGLAGSLPIELPGQSWVLPPGTLSPLQTNPYPVAFICGDPRYPAPSTQCPANGLPAWRVPGSGANPLDPNDDVVFRGPAAAHATLGAALGVPVTAGRSFWEYPEDMQIFGLSAATNILSWSVSAEMSYQQDIPVQINGNDLLNGLLAFVGPYGQRGLAAASRGADGYARGYDLFIKRQFQVNAVKTFSNVLGAENVLFIGEVGAQSNNVPDYTKGGIRYGRGFMFGTGSNVELAQASPTTAGNTCSPTVFSAPVPLPSPVYNPQPDGCKNDGYVTDFAWGYRLRLNADYNNVFNTGVTVTPSVFWAHDVDGVSMDPTFNDGRQTIGLGVKFSLNKRYTLEANYVDYNQADFDPLGDRDFYSVSASVTF